MSMKAGTSGFLGPRVRAMNAPICGAATVSGGGVARVPLVLVARVEDEAEVVGLIGADQRAAIHDARDALQSPENLM